LASLVEATRQWKLEFDPANLGDASRQKLAYRIRMPAKAPQRSCPTCGKPTSYFSEPVGPFCSARCQLIDLGKWFGEEYRISEPLRPDHFEGFEELPIPPESDQGAEET
jgi:hypothetical protein